MSFGIDNINIFVNHNMKYDDNNIVLGTMTGELCEGVAFVECENVLSEFENCNNNINMQLSQRVGISDIGDANKYFSNFNIIFGKKPIWRKLLNIR